MSKLATHAAELGDAEHKQRSSLALRGQCGRPRRWSIKGSLFLRGWHRFGLCGWCGARVGTLVAGGWWGSFAVVWVITAYFCIAALAPHLE